MIEVDSLEAAKLRIADLEKEVMLLRTGGGLVNELNLVPPRSLAMRVGGGDENGNTYPDFLISGFKIASDLKYLMRQYGVDETKLNHTLDFGCGPARAVRYLSYERYGGAKSGCDIDVEAITWNKEHIPGVNFFVSPARPPLPIANETFDFIYAISIFTHFNEEFQDLWLEELARVSSPNAILILTKQGQNRTFGQLDDDKKKQVEETGIFYDETNIYNPQPVVGFEYPESFKLTWHSDQYVRDRWSRHLDVVDISHRAIGFDQDAVILRPKKR